jgi:hypothetical protein
VPCAILHFIPRPDVGALQVYGHGAEHLQVAHILQVGATTSGLYKLRAITQMAPVSRCGSQRRSESTRGCSLAVHGPAVASGEVITSPGCICKWACAWHE